MKNKNRLAWPANLRQTRVRAAWFNRFKDVELGLDLQTLAKQLGTTYTIAQRWAQTFAYEIRDRRRECQVEWNLVNWDLRDAALSRALGVSRERVRQVRRARNERPSVDVLACKLFEQYAYRNALALHGRPVADAIVLSGQRLKRSAAGRILRRLGIQAFRSQPRWSHLNWKLPNRDLSRIYGLDARQVASIRSRLGVGAAAWDVAGGRKVDDAAYQSALQQEERQAGKVGRSPIDVDIKLSAKTPAMLRRRVMAAAAT